MPISVDRFEAEEEETLDVTEGTQPYQILKFLAERPDQAFTQTELHEATGINRGSVGAVLSRLERRDLVRRAVALAEVARDALRWRLVRRERRLGRRPARPRRKQ